MILDLGKARESTMVAAESFKDAARKYAEARGYAQILDSLPDAHPADMVFRPTLGPGPDLWVECKATKLSLGNQDLKREIRNYALEWMKRDRESRFEFWLFAESVANREAWNEVFGPRVTAESIRDWLGDIPEDPDFIAFFVHATVAIGDAMDLADSTRTRLQQNSIAGDVRRQAKETLQRLENRAFPLQKKSTLLSNLIEFVPPERLAVVSVQAISDEEVRRRMRFAPRPPFVILERGLILTLDLPNVLDAFEPVDGHDLRRTGFDKAFATWPNKTLWLLNDALGDYLWKHGVSKNEGRYFFRAEQELEARKEKRTIPTEKSQMTVAKIMYPKDLEEEERTTDDVHHVAHEAFTLRTRYLWGKFYAQLNLHRLFTEDGRTVIKDSRAAALDAFYRRPEYNRSDTQQNKTVNLANHFFLRPDRRFWPDWGREFTFVGLFSTDTGWTPEPYEAKQRMLLDYESTEDSE